MTSHRPSSRAESSPAPPKSAEPRSSGRSRLARVVGRVALVGVLVSLVGLGAVYLLRYELARLGLGLATYTHDAGAARQLTVPMRDGALLQTQVYLPKGGPRHPTVLIRNPYNIANVFGFVCGVFVRYGYACVHQDVRGRMGSEGEWTPLAHEREDGLDTLAWLVEQPFQDGNIALWGMSYLAAVQWAVADRLPPQVKTMVPMVFATDAYPVHYGGGMYRHEIFTAWAALMPGDSMRLDHGDEYSAAVAHRPHAEVDEKFFGRRLPWYRSWITSPNRADAAWQNPALVAFREAPRQTAVPVLMFGGWYDFFLPGQLEDFRQLATRSESRLVIGPWHHLQRSEVDQPGDIGIGGQWRQTLNWLDHHLRGAPLEGPTGVVQTYVYGEGRWRVRSAFPPPDAESRRWFLTDLARAPHCAGGTLSATTTATASVSYRYDPDDPVPAHGGATVLAFAFRTFDAVAPGPRAIDGICRRPDVLTFRSAPLAEPVRLAGSAIVDLLVSSTAPDTAFSAKLMEVRPDGTTIHVREAIRAVSYREGDGEGPPKPYLPGSKVGLALTLSAIEWTFPPGSRIRLDVSSSSFPVYHAHPNRFGPWAEQTGADVATNTVHSGSRLTLPVARD